MRAGRVIVNDGRKIIWHARSVFVQKIVADSSRYCRKTGDNEFVCWIACFFQGMVILK